MLGPYRQILSLPGALAFSAAGLLARFPGGMISLGIILMLSALTGSYATAGSVAATFVVAQAVCAPQLARLVDRHGQARVMAPSLALSAAGLLALVLAAVTGAPTWTLYAAAAVAGATVGSMGALVRARWTQVVRTPGELHSAFSLESALDEVTFVVGPVVATVLATGVAPWAGVSLALVLVVVGGYTFLAQRATEPPLVVVEGRAARGSVMRSAAMAGLVGVFVFVGSIFGASDVATVAFTAEQGSPGAAGVLLGIFATGSMIAGLLYGAKVWEGPAWRRFLLGVVVLAVGSALFLLVGSLPVMAAVMFVTGFAISPTIINGNAIIQHIVAPGRLTEGLTWLSTGINLGVSVGASVAGAMIDRAGSVGGFGTVAVSGLLAVLAALFTAPVLRRRAGRDLPHVP
ncbi:MFS transporter [Georgenia thermotolerans]|uniref:MFS transporter n=1 Tax=Georgenia thermotolerans TaxID=527326 RepID=A0A7J5UTB3_9MICO|nr:MFS transporter [Georgenia thermotolerans]KAE8765513.1 MFS transporter [Georgenia thermotolerans]